MNPDTFCTSDQWSMIASAPSTSQLAGVLGGFLITAIALLFDRSSREGVHTLALFSSAVLILMLDSFLFSLISGTHPPGIPARNRYDCPKLLELFGCSQPDTRCAAGNDDVPAFAHRVPKSQGLFL